LAPGGVDDRDPGASGGSEIDVVDSRSVLGNDLEAGAGCEHLSIDAIETDKDRLGVGDRLDEVSPGLGMILGSIDDFKPQLRRSRNWFLRESAEGWGEDGETHQAPISIPKVSNTV
jgi:hypothetical protein